jgi:Fur family peroxide stress response transcriptional regulator
MDLQLSLEEDLDELAAKNFPGTIESHRVLFTGICPDCVKASTIKFLYKEDI